MTGVVSKKLNVTMLGSFQMEYGGRVLRLERSNTTKAMQVLQHILYCGEEGVSRALLLEVLYGDGDPAAATNNLKVTISNLRRLLQREGLPGEALIRFEGGYYYWCCQAPLSVDVRLFASLSEKAQSLTGAERDAVLTQACALYKGEFLPHLHSRNWVIAAAAQCRELYFDCVRLLGESLRTQGRFEQLLPVAAKAAGLYPQEEFVLMQIDCLIELQRYRQARKLYDEALARVQSEFGLGPGAGFLERFRRLEAESCGRDGSLDHYLRLLREKPGKSGAYYCAFPGFIDAFRVALRLTERSGQAAYLLFFWLCDAQGRPLQDAERLADASPLVRGAIGGVLRRGDVYTQAALGRFLILLVGTSREHCEVALGRILESYRQDPVRGIGLQYKVVSAQDIEGQQPFEELDEE